MSIVDGAVHKISSIKTNRVFGYIKSIIGNNIKVSGIKDHTRIGDVCVIENPNQESSDIDPRMKSSDILAEVIGFDGDLTIIMPQSEIFGIGPGYKVSVCDDSSFVYPSLSWLGRVINANAEAIDNKGPLGFGQKPYLVKNSPPISHSRRMVEERIDLGVRSINTFLTCCKGQRMGIFAGSGVGKSVLMSQLAKFSKSDVNVIGLVGERGREVAEFIDKYLGQKGLEKTIIIASTSDESPILRKRAAYLTMAISEYFRDQGLEVLCMIDSVTRFAFALREIGLSCGEPPTTKGYPPSVFAELPKLLERAGSGVKDSDQGNITGIFTVLVDSDDHDEPVADAVRGILDGHIVLDRKIAERGRFPPINILRSVSRTMPDCNPEEDQVAISKARKLLSVYVDIEDMINIGAYVKGSNENIDKAILFYEKLEEFLSQGKNESDEIELGFDKLRSILNEVGY